MSQDLLQDFPVIVDVPVAWGEMDSFGHVNNIVFFRYFENARIRYFERVGLLQSAEHSGIGPILGSTSARFRKPLVYPDTVRVGTRITHLNSDRFQHEYRVVSQAQNLLVAEGESITVAYDHHRLVKAEYPKDLLERITALEKRSLPPLQLKKSP